MRFIVELLIKLIAKKEERNKGIRGYLISLSSILDYLY